MSKRLSDRLTEVRAQLRKVEGEFEATRRFSAQMAATSLRQHIAELEREAALIEENRSIEMMEWRLKAPRFGQGAIPLNVLAEVASSLWHVLGYVANSASTSGKAPERVPPDIYGRLDARLAAIMPGSTRLVITTASNRDLFDYGLSKETIGRVFRTLESGGEGEDFAEAAASLGSDGARHLKELLHLIGEEDGSAELIWRYSGGIAGEWSGDNPAIVKLENALESADIKPREIQLVSGTIDTVSRRKRIILMLEDKRLARISYPPSLMASVETLQINRRVTLRCAITDVVTFGGKRTTRTYELIDIVDTGENPADNGAS